MSDLSITQANTMQALNQATSTKALGDLRKFSPEDEQTKIRKAAQEFESILIGQWLDKAEKSFATVPGEDPEQKDKDPGGDQLQSIAFHALADEITKAGGLGLAALIAKGLEEEGKKEKSDGNSSAVSTKL